MDKMYKFKKGAEKSMQWLKILLQKIEEKKSIKTILGSILLYFML